MGVIRKEGREKKKKKQSLSLQRLTVADSTDTIPWRFKRTFALTFPLSPFLVWKGPICTNARVKRLPIGKNIIKHTRTWKLTYSICADFRRRFTEIMTLYINRKGSCPEECQYLGTRYGISLWENNGTLLIVWFTVWCIWTRIFPWKRNWKGEAFVDLLIMK